MLKIGDMKLCNVEELAELLGVHPKTVRKMIRDGKLKGKKLAKKWYVSEEELIAYFQGED